MANPFLAPDLARARARETPRRRLDGWELMGPLYKAFETGAGGGQASMDLPADPRVRPALAQGPRDHGAPVALPRVGARGPPHVPPGRRAGPGQDRGVGARGIRRRRVPAAGRRPQRREDELGARGRAVDAAAPRDRHLGRRRARRRVRGRVHRQLRDPRSPPVLAQLDRPEGHGRRRGALHQEPRLAALAERARPRRRASASRCATRCCSPSPERR